MAHLTVHNVSDELVTGLNRRAAANGRSAEAEHRALLHAALLGADEAFATQAEALRRCLRSTVDSTETIRAVRDGEP